MTESGSCPACSGARLTGFLRWDSVPVHSCLLLADRQTASSFPRADLDLAICEDCGFVANRAFDAAQNNYSQQYEETQAFSSLFREYSRNLATGWVERYDLVGKRVVEIGCGKGEFLVQMVEAGIAQGVGIDPGFRPERIDPALANQITWVPGVFPADWPRLEADAIVCRHTLEHIAPVGEFLRQVRLAIGDRTDTIVLFEVPDVLRVLREGAFWDVYYEHCSYFSAGSLARLFRSAGFEVLHLWRAYDDQYLVIEARPSRAAAAANPLLLEDDLELLRGGARMFAANFESVRQRWSAEIAEVRAAGGRTVIWGSSSKGVAFLAALGDGAATIDAAVDINPHKHGMYMAGSGHEIVPPAALAALDPQLVIIMNPAYRREITDNVLALGVRPRLEAL